jgi:hypothetical protein
MKAPQKYTKFWKGLTELELQAYNNNNHNHHYFSIVQGEFSALCIHANDMME